MIAEVHQRAREHATQLAEALLGEDEAQVVQVGAVSDVGNRNRLRTDELEHEHHDGMEGAYSRSFGVGGDFLFVFDGFVVE